MATKSELKHISLPLNLPISGDKYDDKGSLFNFGNIPNKKVLTPAFDYSDIDLSQYNNFVGRLLVNWGGKEIIIGSDDTYTMIARYMSNPSNVYFTNNDANTDDLLDWEIYRGNLYLLDRDSRIHIITNPNSPVVSPSVEDLGGVTSFGKLIYNPLDNRLHIIRDVKINYIENTSLGVDSFTIDNTGTKEAINAFLFYVGSTSYLCVVTKTGRTGMGAVMFFGLDYTITNWGKSIIQESKNGEYFLNAFLLDNTIVTLSYKQEMLYSDDYGQGYIVKYYNGAALKKLEYFATPSNNLKHEDYDNKQSLYTFSDGNNIYFIAGDRGIPSGESIHTGIYAFNNEYGANFYGVVDLFKLFNWRLDDEVFWKVYRDENNSRYILGYIKDLDNGNAKKSVLLRQSNFTNGQPSYYDIQTRDVRYYNYKPVEFYLDFSSLRELDDVEYIKVYWSEEYRDDNDDWTLLGEYKGRPSPSADRDLNNHRRLSRRKFRIRNMPFGNKFYFRIEISGEVVIHKAGLYIKPIDYE